MEKTGVQTIATSQAPAAVGPYSQATISNGFVFCSGQIGIDPETGALKGTTITEQTEQVLRNLIAVLRASGTTIEKVMQTTCYVKNLEDYQLFNEIYSKTFFQHKPARATVEVAALPKGALVEISAIAIL